MIKQIEEIITFLQVPQKTNKPIEDQIKDNGKLQAYRYCLDLAKKEQAEKDELISCLIYFDNMFNDISKEIKNKINKYNDEIRGKNER